ncbi:hypothetical protein [Brenneria goodwinii]
MSKKTLSLKGEQADESLIHLPLEFASKFAPLHGNSKSVIC